ncbi:hypothetical protein [Hymenobacter chitinivorans]|uniref:Uncharacterized protein n=1 Tax=Hymenobacter chitinivorans DSM 11115 TaxID=1121954 RepID=A0A2M9BQB2_9BACT|nr:hypothetical protein [Hymenobacter chitinivorans]PJJ60144.1 hypothetical protein CLV45_1569 [Hymenobacter chitinivorans DSM 11115]
MHTLEQSPEIVAKEVISTFRFSATDVLPLPAQQQWRRYEAERATTLGNGYHSKVDIYFQTADGRTKRVYTTVWACDAEHLTLKSGGALPLRAVVGFDFY